MKAALMLSLYARPHEAPLPFRNTISAMQAAELIGDAATLAVEHIGDDLARAIARSFVQFGRPSGLTIIYSWTRSLERDRGLNRLAQDGLVQRVIGGQWYPVPALQKMAQDDRIEAYSLPSGLIQQMLRATAAGRSACVSRSGLGSFTDPRNGGGRLNARTRMPILHLTQAPMSEALIFPSIPIDVGLVGVGFREETASLVMTRDAAMLAEATHRRGGIVIAGSPRRGTVRRLRRGEIEVPDTVVDHIVGAGEDG